MNYVFAGFMIIFLADMLIAYRQRKTIFAYEKYIETIKEMQDVWGEYCYNEGYKDGIKNKMPNYRNYETEIEKLRKKSKCKSHCGNGK